MEVTNQTVADQLINSTISTSDDDTGFTPWLIGCIVTFLIIILFAIIRPLIRDKFAIRLKSFLQERRTRRDESLKERALRNISKEPIPANEFISYVNSKKKQNYFRHELVWINDSHEDSEPTDLSISRLDSGIAEGSESAKDNVEIDITDIKLGKFHDQRDAKWIVIRGQLRGHNDTPFGRPTPGRIIGRPGVGRPQGVFGGFSYY
jgi:hypothetical protein